MARLLLVAGGTGGHVFPALSVMRELQSKGHEAAFVTDTRGARFCKDQAYYRVSAEAVMGRGLLRKIKAAMMMGWGYLQSHILLLRARPDMVVGFGGYAAMPLVLAAQHQGRRTYIHEQNAIMGRVNRLLAKRAHSVFLSFADTQKVPEAARIVVTGNPLSINVEQPAQTLNDEMLNILVLGGSQGAGIFDAVVPDAVAKLSPEERGRLHVHQQVATIAPEELQALYTKMGVAAQCARFIDQAARKMFSASLLIARAGGGITTEASLAHLPSLFVPLPIAADDHQWFNAEFYANAGAAENVRQPDFHADHLAARLRYFLADPEPLQQMRKAMVSCAQPAALETLIARLEDHDQTA